MGYKWGILEVWPTYEPFTNLEGHPSRHLSNGLLYKPRSLFICARVNAVASRSFMGSLLAIPPLMADVSFLNGYSQPLLFHQKIEWDLTNGPLSKLLELLDTQV